VLSKTKHGGYCCGRRHIYGFFGRDKELIDQLRKLVTVEEQYCTTRGFIYEVVLTNAQCNAKPQVLAAMKEIGFKLVYRAVNKNSGAMCNVFMYHRNPAPLTQRLPASLRGFND